MIRQRHLEKAQGLVEYAMILVLVAVVVIAVLQIIGPTIGNVFSEIIEDLQFISN
jgi:pilus assembly protein Flp/PilA